MTPREVFERFQRLAPDFSHEKVTIWYPHGQNTIRLRMVDRKEFIFSIENGEWHLQTLAAYLKSLQDNRLKGEKS